MESTKFNTVPQPLLLALPEPASQTRTVPSKDVVRYLKYMCRLLNPTPHLAVVWLMQHDCFKIAAIKALSCPVAKCRQVRKLHY